MLAKWSFVAQTKEKIDVICHAEGFHLQKIQFQFHFLGNNNNNKKFFNLPPTKWHRIPIIIFSGISWSNHIINSTVFKHRHTKTQIASHTSWISNGTLSFKQINDLKYLRALACDIDRMEQLQERLSLLFLLIWWKLHTHSYYFVKQTQTNLRLL